jgi:heme a synthase
MHSAATTPPGLHRFAVILAGAVLVLISAGALVTSRGAGLAVPDWPTSFGMLNPPRWWEIANVRAEHGHRLIAGTVALATVILAVWMARREPNRRLRRLAWAAVGAVLAQALLGGITVLLLLPTAVSVAHAGLAEIFFCLVVSIAVATSPAWQRPASSEAAAAAARLRPLASALTAVVYVQILLGAVMRHLGAGLAIPDFPLAFGRLVPRRFDLAIGVHYAHRVGAAIVLCLVLWTAAHVLSAAGGRDRRLRWPALALSALVGVQIALGATVIWTARAVVPNTAHVATGALLLATSLILTLFTRRLAAPAAAPSAASATPARTAAAPGGLA